MSLNSWSYPFYDDKPAEKRATSRKKINTTQLKKVEVDDDNLADFNPMVTTPPEEPQPEPVYVPSMPAPMPAPMSAPMSSNLTDKINYMIYLLEEQKDDKTGRVTEEMILYVFLGIFVIFVLDSFVKTGKYSR